MFQPMFYEIRPRLAHQASTDLADPELIDAARAPGRDLGFDSILHVELDRAASTTVAADDSRSSRS